MKEEETRAKNLLDIIRESKYICCDTFIDVLADTRRESSLLPWAELPEDRSPLDDILKDMHREQAMEALYNRGAVSEDELNRFREELLADRLEYLAEHNIAWAPIRFRSTEPALVRDEARLYKQCIEAYLDRKSKYEPHVETVREDLEYVEILAGKIAHDFPGLCPSDMYNREVLETQVEIYSRGLEDIAEKYGLTAEEHAAKTGQAEKEIEYLYSVSD